MYYPLHKCNFCQKIGNAANGMRSYIFKHIHKSYWRSCTHNHDFYLYCYSAKLLQHLTQRRGAKRKISVGPFWKFLVPYWAVQMEVTRLGCSRQDRMCSHWGVMIGAAADEVGISFPEQTQKGLPRSAPAPTVLPDWANNTPHLRAHPHTRFSAPFFSLNIAV